MESSVSNLHIDRIYPEDAERLSQVAQKAYYDHFVYLWEDNGVSYVQAMFSEDVLHRDLADPQTRYYLASQDQQPVGYLRINLEAPLDEYKNVLELSRIYLTKEGAGQGIGKKLVQRCFEEAVARQKEVVWLKVLESSKESIAFYCKQEFVKHADITFNYPRLKIRYQSIHIMKKTMPNHAH